jgi:hypothetical protein
MKRNGFIVGLLVLVSVWASADAPSFTAVANSAFGASNVNCVAYGNGKVGAGGYDGYVIFNNNGTSWTAVGNSAFGSTQINGISYGAGKFVAVGEGGEIAYSPDGITWTLVAEPPFSEANLAAKSPFGWADCITYGNGKFVAGGGYEGKSRIAYSTDGITWNTVSGAGLPFPFSYGRISAIAYDSAGNYLAISYNGMGDQSAAAYSPDAITWTMHADGPYSEKSAVAYGNGKFVYAFDHILAYTPDGVTGDVANGFNWRNNPNSIFGSSSITCIAYGAGIFAAGGHDGKMAYSTDGLTWNLFAESRFGTTQINGIAFGNGKFVAVGNDGKIVYSN